MKAKYNVVFVGKTGTGKSSLINYLYGDKVARTGVGRSVTQRGFHPVDMEINGLPVKLFDSWGLEIGKEKEWMQLLDEELKNRGTEKPPEDWFHSVFYCIAASGHRIEDFDIKIIKQFMDNNYVVAVILTKADTISEDDKRELIDAIHLGTGQFIPVIPVCSEEKTLLNGIKTCKFGKGEVELRAYNNFWESIILRLPKRCIKILEQKINDWHKKQKTLIEKKAGRFNPEILDILKDEAESFITEEFKDAISIKKEIQRTLFLYGVFAKLLNYPPSDSNETNIKFPTGDGENIKWWEWFTFVPWALAYILIWGVKQELIELIDEFKSKLTELLPKIEKNIEKELKRLKENYNTPLIA